MERGLFGPPSAPPVPPPDRRKLSDFADPYQAFYWLGYFVKNLSIREAPPEPPEPRKQPLCDTAEFCVFDTETSGLSAKDVAIQCAVGFFSADGKPMGFYDRLWKLPKGTRINYGSYKIHGISEKKLEEDGYDAALEIRSVLKMFQRMRERGKRIVAHNASFDCRMLAQTARQHGVDGWDITTADMFCTMQNSKPRCGLVSEKTGRPKAPSNAELYKILTGTAPSGALHDALVDIKVTGRSFVEGQKRGWW
jgi:DNA polymerase III epsilon subunit-like protein